MKFQIQYHEVVDSTNLLARNLAQQGAAEGTVVTAGQQTAGRGRRGRTWLSPPDTSIYMSLILRPQIKPEQASMLTLVMGLSVVQACRGLYHADAWIKWPNDMVINKKKVCGILTELNFMPVNKEEEAVKNPQELADHEMSKCESAQKTLAKSNAQNYPDFSVVIGVGMNVNQQHFPEEIMETATSLALEMGTIIDREKLMAEILRIFANNYEVFLESGDLRGLKADYNQVLINRGQSIRVLEPTGEYNGVSGGINDKGELLVTREDGSCTAVYAGEVSVRGVYGYV